MPRIITTQVYTFDELSNEAKANAREWWRRCERQDPAWWSEHQDSAKAAENWCRNLPGDIHGQALADWIRVNESAALTGCCPWTGYCDDEVALDVVRSFLADPTKLDQTAGELLDEVADAMSEAWDAECEHMEDDDDMVDDNIRANNYEFTADGTIA